MIKIYTYLVCLLCICSFARGSELVRTQQLYFEESLTSVKHIKHYTLTAMPEDGRFMRLVSHEVDDSGEAIAFIVTPIHSQTYAIKQKDLAAVGLSQLSDGLLLAVVTHDPAGSTVNLRYPIVVNLSTGAAKLLVPLNSKVLSLAYPLVRLGRLLDRD
ncbi:MAG TPA: flagellar assembly protein FliW [Opitutales bacterium]|nr:flagellar assembly protein FliW [Opitutales bacterium]